LVKAVRLGVVQVLRDSGIHASDIRGIGISGQMHSLVMLDENNRVLRAGSCGAMVHTAECDEIHQRVAKSG
jgi:xylulokinase